MHIHHEMYHLQQLGGEQRADYSLYQAFGCVAQALGKQPHRYGRDYPAAYAIPPSKQNRLSLLSTSLINFNIYVIYLTYLCHRKIAQ